MKLVLTKSQKTKGLVALAGELPEKSSVENRLRKRRYHLMLKTGMDPEKVQEIKQSDEEKEQNG